MKYKVKLGDIVVTDRCTHYENGETTRVEYKPLEVKGVEVELEISSEEMLTQMKNVSTFCNGVLEFYKIIKGEVASGEIATLIKGINDIKTGAAFAPNINAEDNGAQPAV